MLLLLEKIREQKTKKKSFGLKRLIQKIQAGKYELLRQEVRKARLRLWRKRSLVTLCCKLHAEGKMSYKQVVYLENEAYKAYKAYSVSSREEYKEIGKFYDTMRRTRQPDSAIYDEVSDEDDEIIWF